MDRPLDREAVSGNTFSALRTPAWLKRLFADRLAVLGVLLLAAFILIGLLAPYLAPNDPVAVDLGRRLLPSSAAYPLGTDHLGRCVLSRLIWGTRVSLSTSFIVLLTIMGISIPFGMLAGWCGGLMDGLLMRLVDILLAFPRLIFALVIAGMLGPSLANTMLAVGAVSWVGFARLIRGLVLQVKERDFIQAARVCGTPPRRILTAHVLPNIAGPLVVLATLDMGWLILSISGLSFLGLGAQPPTPEWGAMLNDSRPYFQVAPNLMLYPGLAVMLAVLAFNLLGDGLRDLLDPRGLAGRR
ncbi:MAG: ABC transporter permease subunit [Peptococcaceae bacterium]|nr:ABC transporter permease subunit [Peptococcaceae bacterium]